jgi:hypothetical protein
MIHIKASLYKSVRRQIETMLIGLPLLTQKAMEEYGEQTTAEVMHKATAAIVKTAKSITPGRDHALKLQLVALIFTAMLLLQKIHDAKKEPVL